MKQLCVVYRGKVWLRAASVDADAYLTADAESKGSRAFTFISESPGGRRWFNRKWCDPPAALAMTEDSNNCTGSGSVRLTVIARIGLDDHDLDNIARKCIRT